MAEKDYERRAREAVNKIVQDLWAEDGKIFVQRIAGHRGARFDLKQNQNIFLYYRDEATGRDFCYTPHRDTDGFFWSFEYVPYGPGSRSGKAKRFRLKYAVKHRKRYKAEERALKRRDKFQGRKEG